MRLLQSFENNVVGRVSNWGGFFAIIAPVFGVTAAGFAWVAKQMTRLGPIGWPEAVFIGLGVAAVIVVLFSAALVAWRLFRPLPPVVAATPIEATPTPTTEAGRADAIGRPAITLDQISSALYIAAIEFDTHRLKSDYIVRFLVRVFNGSGFRLEVIRPNGAILIRSFKDKKADYVELPRLLIGDGDLFLAPYGDRFIEYEQRVPGDLAKQMMEWIETAEGIEVRLQNVVIAFRGDQPEREIALTPWRALRVFRMPEHIHSGRIIEATMNVTL